MLFHKQLSIVLQAQAAKNPIWILIPSLMQDDEGKYYGDACGRCCWQVYWPVFWLGLALTPCAVSELCAKPLAPSKSDLQMARILVFARHFEILFGPKPLSCLFYFPKDTKNGILSCIEFQGSFQQFMFEYSILLLSKMHPLLLVRVRAFHEMKIFIRWFFDQKMTTAIPLLLREKAVEP